MCCVLCCRLDVQLGPVASRSAHCSCSERLCARSQSWWLCQTISRRVPLSLPQGQLQVLEEHQRHQAQERCDE